MIYRAIYRTPQPKSQKRLVECNTNAALHAIMQYQCGSARSHAVPVQPTLYSQCSSVCTTERSSNASNFRCWWFGSRYDTYIYIYIYSLYKTNIQINKNIYIYIYIHIHIYIYIQHIVCIYVYIHT